MQHSFMSGELAPALNARVDLAKYHTAAALLTNFFVDYRGGASTRTGTKYILQAYKSATAVRLIPFQASFTVNYALEFGDFYIRFYNNGAPVVENGFAISAATQANPAVLTIIGNNYAIGDWFFVPAGSVVGMTQLNGKYFSVKNVAGNAVTIGDLNGNNINSTSYSAYVSGGLAERVYTLQTPFAAADLALLKFAQNVSTLVLCHPNYPPYILTLISTTNWTLIQILFGPTIATPTGVTVTTTLTAGTAVHYAYVVTGVDTNGQESVPSTTATVTSAQDLRTTPGTNSISWAAVPGAVSYNVYKAELSYAGALPAGTQLGFIGNCTGTSFIDSNIGPDFSETPPIVQNPFVGASVLSITVTAGGTYTTIPTVTIAAPPGAGFQATAQAVMTTQGTPTLSGGPYAVTNGDKYDFGNGVILEVIASGGAATGFKPVTSPGSSPGSLSGGSIPSNPVSGTKIGSNPGAITINANLSWKVGLVQLINGGAGYITAPSVTFSSGAATATSAIGDQTAGNPSVPAYFQQRLVLAGPLGSPQTFYMSQPGSYFNYNISDPVQADDAITDTIASTKLSTIKSMLSMQTGLIVLADVAAWLVNGGGQNQAITPIDATAQTQSYNGSCDVPPIVANNDILYVQAKNSIVRDMTFNFYTNIYTGTDISVLSSHLFFGYQILEWAYAEEPFKLVWAVRNDGVMLSLTYVKEQEVIGWSHHTTMGNFKSVCAITETITQGVVDALYTVVQRTVNGNVVQYIERLADRYLIPSTPWTAWCVDAGLQYSGAATAVLTGLDHLVGQTVTGVSNGMFGVIIPPTIVAADGSITLPSPITTAIVGLAFTPQIQTLALDLGEPTVQGKRKHISAVTLRCENTLGLSIGASFSTLVPMKDLVLGGFNIMTNSAVAGLVTGDARTILDPTYNVPGQYCIQQNQPYPATVLGVIPEVTIGDTTK